MSSVEPLDPSFPLTRQMEVEAAPIVLVNLCTMAPEDEAAFLVAWAADAAFMKSQPGFISTQLHRALETAQPTSTMRSLNLQRRGARPSGTPIFRRRRRRIRRRRSFVLISFRRSLCRTCAPHSGQRFPSSALGDT